MKPDEESVSAQDLKPALESRFYNSPDIFRLESQRIFHDQWFCVGRAEQLREKGDCLHVDVAGESVLVLRGRDDALRGFYNVCRHRGSQLVRTLALPDIATPDAVHSGRIAGAVVCGYHSWSYNLDGSLRAAPFVRFDEQCPKERFSLVPVNLETWGGFIFLNLATKAPSPLLTQVDSPAQKLVRYALEDLRRGVQLIYDVQANWKVILENYNECYHCGPVHPELCALVPAFRAHGGADLDWAGGVPHRPGAWTFTSTGTSARAPFPGLSDKEKSHHNGDVAYPNLMLSVAAEHVAAFTLWPKSPDLTRIACEFLFHPSEIEKPGFDPSDVVDFWDIVNRQDWRVCESVQAGMKSRGFRGGFYAPMEDPSLDIRRYLEKRLGDLSQVG